MQDHERDENAPLKAAALEIYARLTVEELQTVVAVAIETLTFHHLNGIEGMLEMLDDGVWDNFFDTVKCDPRGGV